MSKFNLSRLICNHHRRSRRVYLTDLSSLNLSTQFFSALTELQMPVGWKYVPAVRALWIHHGEKWSERSDVLVFPIIYAFSMTRVLGGSGRFHNLVSLTLSVTPLTSSPHLYIPDHLLKLSYGWMVSAVSLFHPLLLWLSTVECLRTCMNQKWRILFQPNSICKGFMWGSTWVIDVEYGGKKR